MTDKNLKLTRGQKFMTDLDIAAKNKKDLLTLARDVIQHSPSKRTFLERKLPENETALNMSATYAVMNAYTRKDLSTDQRLILIKQRYHKMNFGDFDKDFKKAFPKEYGIEMKAVDTRAIIEARKAALLR